MASLLLLAEDEDATAPATRRRTRTPPLPLLVHGETVAPATRRGVGEWRKRAAVAGADAALPLRPDLGGREGGRGGSAASATIAPSSSRILELGREECHLRRLRWRPPPSLPSYSLIQERGEEKGRGGERRLHAAALLSFSRIREGGSGWRLQSLGEGEARRWGVAKERRDNGKTERTTREKRRGGF